MSAVAFMAACSQNTEQPIQEVTDSVSVEQIQTIEQTTQELDETVQDSQNKVDSLQNSVDSLLNGI